jgi:hypothetical protein
MTTVITSFMSSTYQGTEEDLLADPYFKNLQLIYQELKEKGYCYVSIPDGDYEGSIAKFTVDVDQIKDKLYWSIDRYNNIYNMTSYFSGRLSWKGRKNNPKFLLTSRKVTAVFLNYDGEEVFRRLDFNKIKKELLEKPLYDMKGDELFIGDNVLYMNLRYGNGGRLSIGTIKEFKPHARDGYVSVIIINEDEEQKSECNYPQNQVYRL